MLLAIDTSLGTSAALLQRGKTLSFIQFDDPFGHAENVGLAISQALSAAGESAKSVSAVAIGIGPAPYTGLRVGMAAGMAFASALDLPIYGVVTLDAVALEHHDKRVLVVSDAKRKEFFVAAYNLGQRELGPVVKTALELEQLTGYEKITEHCDAEKVGKYAFYALERSIDLSNLSALYLRSPDVAPSERKRVTG